MVSEARDLLFGDAAQKKVLPIPDHFKQGLDLDQIFVPARKVSAALLQG